MYCWWCVYISSQKITPRLWTASQYERCDLLCFRLQCVVFIHFLTLGYKCRIDDGGLCTVVLHFEPSCINVIRASNYNTVLLEDPVPRVKILFCGSLNVFAFSLTFTYIYLKINTLDVLIAGSSNKTLTHPFGYSDLASCHILFYHMAAKMPGRYHPNRLELKVLMWAYLSNVKYF